jgi:hypothetical protein
MINIRFTSDFAPDDLMGLSGCQIKVFFFLLIVI